MNLVSLIMLSAVFFAIYGEAIMCYDCNTAEKSCVNATAIQCNNGTTSCATLTTYDIDGVTIAVIFRSCNNDNGIHGDCAALFGLRTCTSICNADGCNGPQSQPSDTSTSTEAKTTLNMMAPTTLATEGITTGDIVASTTTMPSLETISPATQAAGSLHFMPISVLISVSLIPLLLAANV